MKSITLYFLTYIFILNDSLPLINCKAKNRVNHSYKNKRNLTTSTNDSIVKVEVPESFYTPYPDPDPCFSLNPKSFNECSQPSPISYFEPDVLKRWYMCCLVVEIENSLLEEIRNEPLQSLMQYKYDSNLVSKSVCKSFSVDFKEFTGILPISQNTSYIVDCGGSSGLDNMDFFDNKF